MAMKKTCKVKLKNNNQQFSYRLIIFIKTGLAFAWLYSYPPLLLVERLNTRMSNDSVLERIKRMQEAALNQER